MLKKGIIDEELKALSGRVFSQKSYYLADELLFEWKKYDDFLFQVLYKTGKSITKPGRDYGDVVHYPPFHYKYVKRNEKHNFIDPKKNHKIISKLLLEEKQAPMKISYTAIKSYQDEFRKLDSSLDLFKQGSKKARLRINKKNLHILLDATDNAIEYERILKIKQLLDAHKSNDRIRDAFRDVHEHLESLTERLSGSQVQFMLEKVIDRLLPSRTRPFYATAKSLANTHMKHTVDKILRLIDGMEEEIAACLTLHAPELVQADYPNDINEAGPQQPLLADEPITEHQQDNTSTYGPEEHHVVQGENTTAVESIALSKSLRQIALDLLTPYTFFITPLLIGFLIWKAYATKHSQPVENTLDWIISIVFVSVFACIKPLKEHPRCRWLFEGVFQRNRNTRTPRADAANLA